jgi:hypothetical protein
MRVRVSYRPRSRPRPVERTGSPLLCQSAVRSSRTLLSAMHNERQARVEPPLLRGGEVMGNR